MHTPSPCRRFVTLTALTSVLSAGSLFAHPPSEVGGVISVHDHSHGDGSDCNCVSTADRARVDEAIRRARDAHPLGFAQPGSACMPQHARYQFYPMGTRWFGDALVSNFNDMAPGPNVVDFMCGSHTYDGHDATDNMIRSFDEQLIGVPVFAALDGVVVSAHDGEPDMQTSPQGQPANFVILDSGNGRFTYYWHLKKGSVLVQQGDHVFAGQQIGHVGSSGNSSGPHLHFATYDNLVSYEPFSGACNEVQSGWYDQPPVPSSLYVLDCGFWPAAFTFNYPYAPPRTGTLPFNSPARRFWTIYVNHPNQPIRRVRTIRPDGTVAAQTQFQSSLGSGLVVLSSVDVPFHPDLNLITGEWKLELSVNNVVVVTAPFQVVATVNPTANFPPEAIGVHLAPESPREDQVVRCEVETSLTVDDRDYDVVRYHYVWTVNGNVVRDVISAGQADVLAHNYVLPGASITCTVTPSDGKDDGATVEASTIAAAGTFDCNANGIDDAEEIADGASPDVNGNLVPDSCETLVLYVDASANGAATGTTWRDAFVDLSDALRAARGRTDDALVEIWVAAGTYLPDPSCGDRNALFWLLPHVRLLGGFAGTETSADQRDPERNVTILSGDLNGDDTPNFGNRTDNSYNVLGAVLVGTDALLDGFHIRSGHADGSSFERTQGGGMLLGGSSPVIRRCVFEDDWSSSGGGAVYFDGPSEPRFEWCRFVGNGTGGNGGALRVGIGAAATLVNCEFDSNTAGVASGGALSVENAAATLASCRLANNVAVNGGAFFAWSATVNVVNTLMVSNVANIGGAIDGAQCAMSVTNATIAENVAASHVVHLDEGSPLTLKNSVVWGNVGGAIAAATGSAMNYCITQSPIAGIGNLVADPLFVDAAGGDFRLQMGSPAIDSGSVSALTADEADVDGDGDLAEQCPVALDGGPRRIDARTVADTGEGASPIVDRGAYEYAEPASSPADLNGDGTVGAADLAILLGAWGSAGPGDLTGDGVVDGLDLAVLLGAWSA
ncbi:MAG: peptidoglycan DD-metalloendopeptidase family protein [Phycisphaerales bacterium]